MALTVQTVNPEKGPHHKTSRPNPGTDTSAAYRRSNTHPMLAERGAQDNVPLWLPISQKAQPEHRVQVSGQPDQALIADALRTGRQHALPDHEEPLPHDLDPPTHHPVRW
jgi:hypothetical protein